MEEARQREELAEQASGAAQAAAWVEQHRWSLWGGAALLTATGRMLADAHWCSDTMAGACLGVALTAGTVQLCVAMRSGQAAGDGGGSR